MNAVTAKLLVPTKLPSNVPMNDPLYEPIPPLTMLTIDRTVMSDEDGGAEVNVISVPDTVKSDDGV